jgi:CheY-like chemotaxis protein
VWFVAGLNTGSGATMGDIHDTPPGPGCETGSLDGVRVLLVDDNLENRIVFALLLESCGAEVHATATVGEALRVFETLVPDVVVTDVDLDGESGLDLVNELRTRGERTPAIAVSAMADPAEALASGCQLFLAKPVPLHALAGAIRGVVPPLRMA